MMSEDKNHTHDDSNGPDDPDGAGRGDDANGYGNHSQPDGPDEVNEPGDQYQPQEPPTFEKVWLMFQETDKRFEETDRLLKEQSREADRRFKETDRIVRHAAQMAGGLGNNIGEAAEEYFFNALDNLTVLDGFNIEKVSRRLEGRAKGLHGEFDAVLFCENDILILVEVKHKLHPNDVTRFQENIIPVFRQLFPEYGGKTILGAVAGLVIARGARKKALEMGLLILSQTNQQIRLLNPKGFEPKRF